MSFNKGIIRTFGTTALVLICFGCATHHPIRLSGIDRRGPWASAWVQQKLNSVSLENGVSKEEADKLANVYWRLFCSSCGLVEPARDAGEVWQAQVVSGFMPAPQGDISIHKITGEISWTRGPTISNWNQFSIAPESGN
jgi:hypothetical protein